MPGRMLPLNPLHSHGVGDSELTAISLGGHRGEVTGQLSSLHPEDVVA